MAEDVCCTCATLLSNIEPLYDEKTEKSTAPKRRLDCCGRVICGACIVGNKRFATHCPFCQVSTIPSCLPQGLRDPPAYSPSPSARPPNTFPYSDLPPSYASLSDSASLPFPSKSPQNPNNNQPPDVLHFVAPTDTLESLSFAYTTPLLVLRSMNRLYADHLLAARRTILIPGEYYKGGVSHSPRPIEGGKEEIRRGKIRKWMMSCKVAQYDVALLYLQQADYDLNAAIEAYKADDRWEREHPMKGKGKGRDDKRRADKFRSAGSITGQLS